MQPNILFIQADQFSASALSAYGNRVTKTPHLDALAENGVVFDNAYCNNPLCVPSRASMLTGRLGSNIGVYDNGSEFKASTPTAAHYLRHAGYQTSLIGKMHFIGPDQLHGFEERLTPDIYPTSFVWSEHWDHFPDKHALAQKTFEHVGPCREHRHAAFDDNVSLRAERKIFELAMGDDNRPFFLAASFSGPHEPYLARQEFWDLYDADEIDLPKVPAIPEDSQDYHSRAFERMYRFKDLGLTPEKLRDVRRAYYANVSYIDEQAGRLIKALEATGRLKDTLIIFTSDHGDMLGERGLWWKKHMFEASCRVPLIFSFPERWRPGRVTENVSLVDLLPTLMEMAGLDPATDGAAPLDGNGLSGLLEGNDPNWPDTVFCEIFDGGTPAPLLMARRGNHKYVYSPDRSAQLYDLAADPLELENLAGRENIRETEKALAALIHKNWDVRELDDRIRADQDTRRFMKEALAQGKRTSWDWRPPYDDFYTMQEGLGGYYEWFANRA